jgi:hypothetical protein
MALNRVVPFIYLRTRHFASHHGRDSAIGCGTGAPDIPALAHVLLDLRRRRRFGEFHGAIFDQRRRALVLDTVAEALYLRLGWTKAGVIPNYALVSRRKVVRYHNLLQAALSA